MTTQINRSPSPLIWVSAIAIVLFSGVGIAAFMGWLPSSYGNQKSTPEPEVVTQVAPAKSVHKTRMQVANNTPSKVICADCGVIESVRVINDVRETSGIGLVGGLLGHQVGGGRGKDVATVVGAVGGAVAGDAIEKNTGRPEAMKSSFASTTVRGAYSMRLARRHGSPAITSESLTM